jgi:alpha-1,3/alpha-1,6-mannosyltransferase
LLQIFKEDSNIERWFKCRVVIMRISILHLDLGIGGAEKLIVSMALALKDTSVDSLTKHDVTIYTTHHDKTHCFEETLNERE